MYTRRLLYKDDLRSGVRHYLHFFAISMRNSSRPLDYVRVHMCQYMRWVLIRFAEEGRCGVSDFGLDGRRDDWTAERMRLRVLVFFFVDSIRILFEKVDCLKVYSMVG